MATLVTVMVMGAALPVSAGVVPGRSGGATPFDLAQMAKTAASVEISGLNAVDAATVQDLWSEFVVSLPAHSACLAANPPQVEGKADLAPRAAYAPSTATLFVRPGDLPRLVVFHELAHHLDFTCGAADSIGDELRAAQNLSPNKGWWQDGSPVTWPAEYFANAVAISLGEHSRHGVTDATVELVKDWAGINDVVVDDAPTVTVDSVGSGLLAVGVA